ncbi:hypothetical protein [Hufsiella ginkgonis]|uniref:Glycerophosphoryl diester phosphodiesterase membrane domain-containing protein n=1 Tax=Hufsiella ginkgonis TaxID=2695274 RepID=A0A7K1Y3W1_9SPHI|nr:hypothetical protein [Hufsiella ginkgonis]MXV17557.1 hypothetical protein [Hufsiella ginkgonis]
MELRKQRDFSELISDTFTFVKLNWKPLLTAFAGICGFFIVASIIVSTLTQLQILSLTNDEVPVFPQRRFAAFGLGQVLVLIMALLEHVAIGLTVISYISLREKLGVPPSVEEVWTQVKYYFFQYTGAFILVGLMQVLGIICCVLPGIYLIPISSLILVVLVMENGTIGHAFSRGFSLVKDYWWTTFGALFVIGLVLYAFAMIFAIPAMIIGMGSVMAGTGETISKPLIIAISIVSQLSAVFYILPWVVTCLCYYNLTEVKDGTGLVGRIEKLGSLEQEGPASPEEY